MMMTAMVGGPVADRLAAVLLDASLKGLVVLVLAWLVTLLLRRRAAAIRHLVWSVAMAALLVLPALSAVVPEWRIELPSWVAAAVSGAAPAGPPARRVAGADAAAPDRLTAALGQAGSAVEGGPLLPEAESSLAVETGSGRDARRPASEPRATGWKGSARPSAAEPGGSPADAAGERPAASVERAAPGGPARDGPARGDSASGEAASGGALKIAGLSIDVAAAALFVWLVGATLVLLSLLVGAVRVRLLARGTRRLTAGRCAGLAAIVASRLGLSRSPRLLEGAPDAMPMTWGTLEPVVLLPRGVEEWSNERLEAVLLHELAHVRRRDALAQLVAELARAVHWLNPLAWLAAHRLRIERELACDDQVLLAGSRASSYAQELVELARRFKAGRAASIAGLAMARPSRLGDRVRAVLDESRSRGAVTRRSLGVVAVAASLVVLPLSALVPAAAEGAVADDADAVTVAAPGPGTTVDEERGPEPGQRPARAGAGRPDPDVRIEAAEPPGTAAVVQRGDGLVSGSQELRCWDADDVRERSINHDGDRMTVRVIADGCRFEARLEGDVEFNREFTAIGSLSPDARLRIEEEVGGVERRLEVRPGAGGAPEYSWEIDGQRRAFDGAARAWLGETLLGLVRNTGIGAEQRVAALLEDDGVAGVLAEVEQLASDFVQRRYLEELLARQDLEPAEVRRALDAVAEQMDSDHHRAEVLIGIGTRYRFDDATRDAYLRAERGIDSDHHRRRVLTVLLERQDLTEAQQASLLRSAGEIDSDHHKAELLIEFGAAYRFDPATRAAYLDAERSIDSDHHRRRVLSAFLRQDLDLANRLAVLESASGIDSDHHRAELLIEFADRFLTEPEAMRAYARAVEGIDSDHHKRRVLTALLGVDAPGDVLHMILDSAIDIDSDHHLAELLITVAETYTVEGELREAYLRVADRIGSSHHHDRALAALVRAGRPE